jgi:hypothetical protein
LVFQKTGALPLYPMLTRLIMPYLYHRLPDKGKRVKVQSVINWLT